MQLRNRAWAGIVVIGAIGYAAWYGFEGTESKASEVSRRPGALTQTAKE
jgi:hypothetical protein